MRKYYPFLRPLSAKKEDQAWLVVFDVSVFLEKKVEVKIDSESGSIIEFGELTQS